ncbi:MAG: DUF1573 domain-containing protein [Kiritimatiellae bacterium]|nr:DUF1573 domain-containing protein [Kiritimatiellia bacterium]
MSYSAGHIYIAGLLLFFCSEQIISAPEHGTPTATGAAPRIACDAPVYTFGERDESETIVHTFVIRNTGTTPLEILKVKAACGCTATSMNRRLLPPGESENLKATLKLKGRRGIQKKSIRVHSNDPSRPVLTLWLEGTARVELAIETSFINFGQLSSENFTSERFTHLLSRDPTIEIMDIQGTSKHFEVTAQPDKKGLMRNVRIRLSPPFAKGFMRSDFTIHTTHTNQVPLKLSVSAMMPAGITVIPRHILLRGQHPAGVRRLIIVRAGSIAKFNVLDVELPDKRITWKLSTLRPGTYRIALENIPVDKALNRKVVTILTDAKGYERLDIPIEVVPNIATAPWGQ